MADASISCLTSFIFLRSSFDRETSTAKTFILIIVPNEGTFRIIIVLKLLFPPWGGEGFFFFFFFTSPAWTSRKSFCSVALLGLSSRFHRAPTVTELFFLFFFFSPPSCIHAVSYLFDTVKRGNRELREFLAASSFACLRNGISIPI